MNDTPKHYVMIHSRDCLKCKHLMPSLKKADFPDCHYSQGNTACPAKEVQVIRHIDIDEFVNRLYTALVDDDTVTVTQIRQELKKWYPEDIQKVVSHRLKIKLDNQST